MIDFSTPLAGINAAIASLNKTAANVAQSGFPGVTDSVDLTADAVALIEAKNNVVANIKVLQTENQVAGSTLSILG